MFEFGEMKRKFKPLEKMGCLPPNMHLMMLNTVEQVQEYCPDWYIDMTKQALAMVGISGLSGMPAPLCSVVCVFLCSASLLIPLLAPKGGVGV